jgi:hypothetical protein
MAATVKGTAGLTFGTPTESSVIMQSLDETRSTSTAEASDEDGDVVGFAMYGGQRQEITGEYLWKGSDIGSIGASVTLSGLTAISPAGDVYVIELGTKTSNTGFKTGNFRAISISGVTG